MVRKYFFILFNRLRPIVEIKIWPLILLAMMLFTHCSHDSPVKPPSEEGPVHKIVFSAKDPQGQYKLYTINDDGSELKEIFTNNAEIEDLWVSPKGDQVVCDVNMTLPPIADEQLFIVNIDGTNAKQITHFPNGVLEEPQWFPNGEEILFGRFEPYGAQFYRMRIDGSNLIRITTDDSTSHRHPRLSPDGKKVAFETRDPKNSMWVMNIDGTNKISLSTPELEQLAPEWTPDGTKVIYETHKDTGIWIIGADGSNRQRLCNGLGPHHVSSANGKIVFGNHDGIYTINPDGSGLVKLCLVRSSGYPILWSRDGAKIAFRGDANGDRKDGICIVKANGTGLREITDSKLEIAYSPIRAFDWLPSYF